MSKIIDDVYFKELAEKDPNEVRKRTFCRHNPVERSYLMQVWGNDYAIYPHERRIVCLDSHGYTSHPFFHLFIIYYLLRSKTTVPSNEWISEKDLPGGATFFRGPHEIPTRMITGQFENAIESFHKKCTELHGLALDIADAAYRFDIVQNIPVAVLYWGGDDEFQPEAKIMYDRTISVHLTLDIVFALAVEICSRIASGGDGVKSCEL